MDANTRLNSRTEGEPASAQSGECRTQRGASGVTPKPLLRLRIFDCRLRIELNVNRKSEIANQKLKAGAPFVLCCWVKGKSPKQGIPLRAKRGRGIPSAGGEDCQSRPAAGCFLVRIMHCHAESLRRF
jgi:hypothetical protein